MAGLRRAFAADPAAVIVTVSLYVPLAPDAPPLADPSLPDGGVTLDAPALPPVLGFGTWVGGDMDGNPNVGADTIAHTLAGQRAQVLAAYRRDLRQLADLLTQSLTRVRVSGAVLARIEEYRALLPKAAARLKPRHADMPYRTLLTLVSYLAWYTPAKRWSVWSTEIGAVAAPL